MSIRKILAVATLAATAALTPVTAQAAGHPGAHPAGGLSVEVVKPGQLVPVGGGTYLKLTRTERCLGAPGAWECDSVVNGNQPPGTVSLRSQGDVDGTLYAPLYIGTPQAATMTVTEDGTILEVQVVTLAGHPGYATGYVHGAAQSFPGDTPAVTVYGASGNVLAQL